MCASIASRAKAFVIDFFVIDIAVIFIAMPIMTFIEDTDLKTVILPVGGFIAAVAMLLFKDVFGRSIGKRIVGLKIVTNSGDAVPKWKLVLRNVTTFFWTLELIVAVLSDENKRLTDMMLGIKVIKIPNLGKIKNGRIKHV